MAARATFDTPRCEERRPVPGVSGPNSAFRSSKRQRVVCAAGRAGDSEDPYVVLGIPRGASEKEIKTAYRKKALKFHPDVNKAPNAQEQFLRIKRAYQALTEPETTRKSYQPSSGSTGRAGSSRGTTDYNFDEWQKAWNRSAKKAEEEFYGLEDLFRDLASDAAKKKKGSSSGGTKSLWEELADIGEEFVEFLEQSIGTEEPSQTKSSAAKYYDEMFTDTPKSQPKESSSTGSAKASGAKQAGSASSSSSSSKAGGASSRTDDTDIDELLSKMKKNLGL
eukprot:jgi/Mesvir1/20904/Mv07978-RA.1